MDAVLCIGPDSYRFKSILDYIDLNFCEVSLRKFPDNEVCVNIHGNLSDKVCFIVMSCDPPQEEHLQELYQMVEIAKYQNARKIICIVPYMAYARQDRRTNFGEPISAMIILNNLKALGADAFITFDVHNPCIFENAPLLCFNINTTGLFSNFIIGQNLLNNGLLVSPDRGSYNRVKDISLSTTLPYIILNKHKDLSGKTWYENDNLDVEQIHGKQAIVFDDLCSSGSTFIPLAQYLYESGATNILYFVTHFFADSSKICDKIGHSVKIMGTNTVHNICSEIDVSKLLAEWIIQNWHILNEKDADILC